MSRATRAASALELLPLPNVRRLSDAQLRGALCVWCDTPLTGATAQGLGERPGPDGTRIFPRGCEPCVHREAVRVSTLHTRTCERCIKNTEPCPERRALRDLALEGRREEGRL